MASLGMIKYKKLIAPVDISNLIVQEELLVGGINNQLGFLLL